MKYVLYREDEHDAHMRKYDALVDQLKRAAILIEQVNGCWVVDAEEKARFDQGLPPRWARFFDMRANIADIDRVLDWIDGLIECAEGETNGP